MPLYTDSNYYYAGGSSQLFAPYYPSGVYSLPSVSSAYAPYTSNYSRTVGGSYMLPIPSARSTPSSFSSHGLNSRYQPKLSTIGESSPLITSSRHGSLLPLTRTHSPKVFSYSSASSHTLHSKYIPPRPININTADIDVSSARYRRQREEERRRERDKFKVEPEENQLCAGSTQNSAKDEEPTQQKIEIPEGKSSRSTIKRNRPIVRLSTMRSRSRPLVDVEPETSDFKATEPNNEEVVGWRQKLADDLNLLSPSQTKKSPGQLLRERFLIHDPNSEDTRETKKIKRQEEEDQMIVQVDPDTHICHVSTPSGPSFHDICEDISSDKIDDDLNAGALRKRASIIQEREEELLNQLQHSASGTFQMIHLERRSSHDSVSDETQPTNKSRSKKIKKNKHKITAIVDVQNAPLTPILQENEEDQFSPTAKISPPKPKFSYNVEAVEEHHKIHKILQLPKRKSSKKSTKLPEGFIQAAPKRASKTRRASKKRLVNTAEIFTFDTAMTLQENELKKENLESPLKKVDKEPMPDKNIIEEIASPQIQLSQKIINKKDNLTKNNLKTSTSSGAVKVPTVIPLKTSKSLESTVGTTKSKIKPDVLREKQAESAPTSSSIEKSESIDFWASIGNRESVYIANRKNVSALKQTVEKDEDPPEQTKPLQTEKVASKVKHLANEKNIFKESSLLKIEVMGEPSIIFEPVNIKSENIIKESVAEKANELIKIDKKAIDLPQKSPQEPKKTTSFKEEKTDSLLQIAEDTKGAKSAEPDKKKISSLAIDKEAPIKASQTTKSISPKIPDGHSSKSPEKQPQKQQESPKNTNITTKIVPTTVITITTMTTSITTTTTTTTKPLKNAVTKTINEEAKKPTQVQKTINNNVNLAKDAKKIGTTLATTIKTPIKTEITTTTLGQKKTATTTTLAASKVNKIEAVTEVKKKSDAPKKKSSPATELFEKNILDTKAKENEKSSTTTTKTISTTTTTTTTTTSTSVKKEDSQDNKNNAIINKAKTSPINADGFITIAPIKSALSPTTSKYKNASPIINKTAETTKDTDKVNSKMTDKVKITTSNTGAIKLNALAITPTLFTTTTTSKTCDIVAIATSPIKTTTAIATSSGEQQQQQQLNQSSDKTDVQNNLSKCGTVLDLAQCLRDVDADLEDYIPSSAENSDNDLTDDSTFYCSSVDGCENLSASMKKKLKQKKRKEKQQAEKQAARFDPHKKVKIDTTNKCYVKDEAPRYPLVATPRPLWKREKIVYPDESSEESDSDESGGTTTTTEDSEESEECNTSEEEYEHSGTTSPALASGSSVASKDKNKYLSMSTCSNDSGFEGGTAPSSPKKMLGARETRDSPSTPPSLNPAYKIEPGDDESSYTYTQFQKSGRFAPPATVIPRFKNYCVDDFHFLAVLGKGSFGKVLLAELRDTTYYYAVKCLKKDVVLEDDDVDSTLIERKVLALGTKHPYLCHLFCTFQTESHLFFVMEYLNGGDLMFHIQESGRFPEERARFYGAEIISGLKFLHKKGIIYRDLKLDNVLLDFEGHVRIADFGMCKLQIYLDKTADSFCGTPDYMAPEIIKGEKYNQNVDWWSFGVLLYEMLIGQSPFSGCDEDELFWSICNEIPWFPVYISAEATSILKGLLEKDYTKRIGSQYSPTGEVSEHPFFQLIDWNLLEKKQLEPPFKPQVKHPLDTQYFDRVFTRERVRLTPVDREILQSIDQKQFMGFTYTNPHIALD